MFIAADVCNDVWISQVRVLVELAHRHADAVGKKCRCLSGSLRHLEHLCQLKHVNEGSNSLESRSISAPNALIADEFTTA